MEYLSKYRIYIALHLCILACTIMLGAYMVHITQKDIEKKLEEYLTQSAEYFIKLARITDRNGTDEVIEKIITDCSQRVTYESYLERLATLTQSELETVQHLSELCSFYYTERKMLMVARLEDAYQRYSEYSTLYNTIRGVVNDSVQKERFAEIVSLEHERSTLLNNQRIIQEKIIQHLISGKTIQSEEVVLLLREAQKIGDTLLLHDIHIDTVRNENSV
jgi:hypothetical protein